MGDATVVKHLPKDIPNTEKIMALIDRLDTPATPAQADVKEMRRLLTEIPDLWRAAGDLAETNQQSLIGKITEQRSVRLSITAGCDAIRRDLGYEDASMIEQLIIEQIVLSWLRLMHMEYNLTHASYSHAHHYEKRVSAAQRRFLRACESLGRVRKMDISLQVNVATNGGQQVNVSG